MASPRIPLGWIILAVLVGLFCFFGYQIFKAYSGNDTNIDAKEQSQEIQRLIANAPAAINHYEDTASMGEHSWHTQAGSVAEEPQMEMEMPHVPGQTEDDMRAQRQVMMTPPDHTYSDPGAMDPLEGDVHNRAEFGNNLRHPEQTMELHPPMGTQRMVQSGLGSDLSFEGANRATPYSPEMAQNGGELMPGIVAFENDNGVGFSSI